MNEQPPNKIFEITHESMPWLGVGDIWGYKDIGVFVVVSMRPAKWQGDNIDVYAHIDTWYTCRPATGSEKILWENAVIATQRKNAMRKILGANRSYEFRDGKLCPPLSARMKLDSYDDRWEPPIEIILNPEQIEIEKNYIITRAALSGHEK